MNAARLVARGTRPAVRQLAAGLVEIASPPPSAESPAVDRFPEHRSLQAGEVTVLAEAQRSASPPRDAPEPDIPAPAPGSTPPPTPDLRTLPVARRREVQPAAAREAEPAAASAGPSPAPTPPAEPQAELPGNELPGRSSIPAPVAVAVERAAGSSRPADLAPAASAPVEQARPRSAAAHIAASPEQAASAATPVRPPVVIERIEIVTPPARALPADPLASIATWRAGRSRHGAGR